MFLEQMHALYWDWKRGENEVAGIKSIVSRDNTSEPKYFQLPIKIEQTVYHTYLNQ